MKITQHSIRTLVRSHYNNPVINVEFGDKDDFYTDVELKEVCIDLPHNGLVLQIEEFVDKVVVHHVQFNSFGSDLEIC